MIPRNEYLQRLLDSRDPELVKILTGVRRCGKSSLLKLLKEALLQQGFSEERFIEINYEFASAQYLQEPQVFYEHVKAHIVEYKASVLFIDEVQELEDWAKVVNSVRAEFTLDIYVTGSNGRMFSGEHLTYLSGRYIQIEVYPLSLSEYSHFTRDERSEGGSEVAQLYDKYALYGSLPAVALAGSEAQARSLLDGLYDSVFSRDIILRGGIRNEAAFIRVMKYVLEHIGSQVSAGNIASTLKSQGHPVSSDTVDNYLTLMCNAYLLYQCERYDIRGKERLKTKGKYYVVDNGLRNRALGYPGGNRGFLTENHVFMELKRRGYNITVGTISSLEIDFIAKRYGEQLSIQVSETVLDEKTFQREIAPFKKLSDGYPRILITKDYEDFSHDGIRHVNFYDFLLGQSIT